MANSKFYLLLFSGVIFLSGFLFFIFSQKSKTSSSQSIVVSSKSFTESIILGEMIAILLEEKFNQPVKRKLNLGGTQMVFESLKDGAIDVYAEYTGTGYSSILGLSEEKNPSLIYKKVHEEFLKKWDIVWSPQIGFNNTYAVAVHNTDKRFKSKKHLSEIVSMTPNLKYGSPHEFMQRIDGHVPFVKKYNFNFDTKNIFTMNSGLMYKALASNKIDIAIVYSTDGRIKSQNLKLLKDDKGFFPPYYVSFISKRKTLQKNPSLKKIFSLVENLISEKEMIHMNNQVDQFEKSPKEVAFRFLTQKKIINSVSYQSDLKNKQSFFYYVFRNRVYLYKVIKEHLFLTFLSLFLATITAVPIAILATRYVWLSKIIFPVINTIQTIPSLALLGFLIPLMGIGVVPAIFSLFLYSLLPIIRNTYSSICDIESNYIEAAQGIGLTKMQILTNIELPLALPIIIAGIRTATVIIVGTATLATLIGAGGLGDPIFRGIYTLNTHLILLGAIPVALLGISSDQICAWMERTLSKKSRINGKIKMSK